METVPEVLVSCQAKVQHPEWNALTVQATVAGRSTSLQSKAFVRTLGSSTSQVSDRHGWPQEACSACQSKMQDFTVDFSQAVFYLDIW